MRLSKFIRENMEVILQEWENFALTLNPLHAAGKLKLRDHAQQMLLVICADLDTYQGEHASIEKSKGNAPAVSADTAAEIHASDRMNAGFAIEELVSEYRAVRASVLRLWQRSSVSASEQALKDMLRFNEAIDQSLAESVARYSQMLRESQSVFLAILGHDVRNPLGAISMGAQILLQDEQLPQRHQMVAESIFASTNRVNELVGDLLDFSTSHLGDGIPIKPAPYALGEQCTLVIDEMRAFHSARSIELALDGALDVVWDRARINQALSNLLGNAIEHGDKDTPVWVSVQGGEDIVISVRNMGPVMDAASMRTVFDPAQRFAMRPVSERNHAGPDNLGLGLYITREIVAAHGGRISLSSTLRAGTAFLLTLPRVAPHQNFLQEKDSLTIPAVSAV